jgi:hypothetical protein
MRHLFCFTVVSGLGLLCIQPAAAQVYQCLDSASKKVFSQTPCATSGGGNEKLIVRAPALAAAPASTDGTPVTGVPGVLYGNGKAAAAPKDWAAENAAANARAAAADRSSGGSRQAMPSALGGLRKGGAQTQAQASDKQIIANCEANHGARCSSAGEIAQRRMEQRELTAAERQQQQNAVAARRQREREEAFERSMRR